MEFLKGVGRMAAAKVFKIVKIFTKPGVAAMEITDDPLVVGR